jgi:hypothetical protein
MFVGPLQLASNLKEWNMTNPMKIPGWPEAFSPQMPGFGAAGDGSGGLAGGLDFLKNLWGNSTGPVPGMVLPTLDVDELDQRIKDLKAVLSWLELNASMLNATIQGLEVQRNTIAALAALSSSMGEAAGNTAAMFKMPDPASAAFFSMPPSWPASSPQTAAETKADSDWGNPAAPVHPPESGAPARPPEATAAAPLPAGADWLGFMQDQFKTLATAATPAPSAAAGAVSGKPARAKPAPRSAKPASASKPPRAGARRKAVP